MSLGFIDYRGRLPIIGSPMGYGVQPTISPYGQPVIYIHPDSLPTTYPMSTLGLQGLSGGGGGGGYVSSLDTLYTPYNGGRDNTRQRK